jgi:hypothetical protein
MVDSDIQMEGRVYGWIGKKKQRMNEKEWVTRNSWKKQQLTVLSLDIKYSMRLGPHRKHRVQHFFYCYVCIKHNRPLWVAVQGLIRPTPYTYVCIHCRQKVFSEPSNGSLFWLY